MTAILLPALAFLLVAALLLCVLVIAAVLHVSGREADREYERENFRW